MIRNEDAVFGNLDKILVCLNEGKIDLALELLDKTETDLQLTSTGLLFAQNLRKFIYDNNNCTVFIHEIANGNLNVNPPDDTTRQNYIIAQYKQLHSNLLHLTWQTQQIAKGDLKQKVSFLGEFSIGFNQMIEALREREVLVEKIKTQTKELIDLNASKDKFFSIIAHDLRGPLGGLMGLSEMLADESQPFTTDQKKDMILALSRSSQNIFNLLENLLEWSQMQHDHTAFKPEMNSLYHLITDCIKILSETIRKKDIRITVSIDEDQEIFADKNMFQSVIRNLVSNAVKFTPKGGEVNVSAYLTENNSSVIKVSDTGIGMNNEMVSNLFRLNVNCSRPGTEGENSTGLGLLLCKEFVERHGGELWVESEEGKGSLFCFTIPCNKVSINGNSESKIGIQDGEQQTRSKNLKVLIAEDNENSELLLRIAISPFSNDILEAGTGTEAVEICRKTPDIDLIMMDINMPEMDGLEATRQIRQFNKEIVIIAQTAFGDSESKEKALAAGCTDYIAKPIDLELLLRLIQKHFKK
jgi:signal transduction histidine kinase/ActR/RegA family two-component response regulator